VISRDDDDANACSMTTMTATIAPARIAVPATRRASPPPEEERQWVRQLAHDFAPPGTPAPARDLVAPVVAEAALYFSRAEAATVRTQIGKQPLLRLERVGLGADGGVVRQHPAVST
jgi:hypothetical protein